MHEENFVANLEIKRKKTLLSSNNNSPTDDI